MVTATRNQGPTHQEYQDHDLILAEIQDRVLWLAMQMIHYANNVRPALDSVKVGGHPASSASVVTILTSLYFDYMRAGDKISVKPHASPAYHAIQYLLGNLDGKYLRTLRAFHGLQAYPSQTKDPDYVDFSTGSVGLGPVAPNFAALAEEYLKTHLYSFKKNTHRYISLVGDAELDEGSVWEAIAEPEMEGLDNILWVVDLNRQSLDRVIPGIKVRSWRDMFGANGWNIIDVKYGRRLQSAFAEPNGELLRICIDEMSNQVYQRLLRADAAVLREWLPKTSRYPRDLSRLINRWDDDELPALFSNLGGHDFSMLRDAFKQSDELSDPTVVFAYTFKGWRLPSIGDPHNHSNLLSSPQMDELREHMSLSEDAVWDALPPRSSAGRMCADTGRRLAINAPRADIVQTPPLPVDLDHDYAGRMSTLQMYGLVLTDLARNMPEVAERVVTVSPDVASSTGLGGWINKAGVWARREPETLPEEDTLRALNWRESPQGQHIELGISENNLFMMLGQLGLSYETQGELLFPVGSVYDPFVRRGLDALTYGVYSGAKFILVGVPSGVTLAPEGGAHQSLITPSIGIEMPDMAFYEPCFGKEVEWITLDALERIRRRERSTYLRLTNKRIDQSLFRLPADADERERLRRQTLAGAYRLVDRRGEAGYAPGENVVQIMACGAMLPEAIEAGELALREGIYANVVNLTGPGQLYTRFQDGARAMVRGERAAPFMADILSADERKAPVITVMDGHPHALAWLGGALGTRVIPLGVTEFGQSGSYPELYGEYGIGVDGIVAACFAALE